ncbi:AAA family ATPase [Bradyrhizobium sp. WSM1253]|uniref:AAA family ATPase n=1 Tax=Bradyrhizobium sp. WSM1253 TaxID=319003 RepID=UPI0002D413B4|nr:AAA family ATPase [Bradyrhizobium sp. WSM1253]
MTEIKDEFTGLPNPVDVEAAFQAATGAEAAQACLAEHGVNYTDAKMIAIDDEAPGDTFVFIDAEPDWIALPVYQAGAFADLCLIHRNNPNAFHTVCGRAHWLGADNASRAKIVIHENPVEWLKAGCGGVVSLAGFGHMQHFKDLAKACTIEVGTLDAANDVWEWTFGGDEKALKKIQLNGDADAIRDDLAWQAADTAKRRVRDALDVPAGTDLHKLYRQMESVFTPKPAPQTESTRQTGFNARDLMLMEFAPVSYVVPGYIAEGCTILAGASKLGKSWLVLQAATAVAMGGTCLGGQCEQGDVLYLALEDNGRRLKSRIKMQNPSAGLLKQEMPECLQFETEWPRADQGGLQKITDWLTDHPNAKLVIIDVLKMFRANRKGNKNPYDLDYEDIGPLSKIAAAFNVAIVVVHHTNKGALSSDPFDRVSGTGGISGAADTTLIMARNDDGLVELYGRGRDIEEIETAIAFDKMTCRWGVRGDAREVHMSDAAAAVIRVLTAAGEPMGPTAIAKAAGLKAVVVRQHLPRLAKAGDIQREARGKWAIASQVAPSKTDNTFVTNVTSASTHDNDNTPESNESNESNEGGVGCYIEEIGSMLWGPHSRLASPVGRGGSEV